MGDYIFALDPGSKESGFVYGTSKNILDSGKIPNIKILEYLGDYHKNISQILVEDYEPRNNRFGNSAYQTISFISEVYYLAGFYRLCIKKIRNSIIRAHHNGFPNSTDRRTIEALTSKYGDYVQSAKNKKEPGKVQLSKDSWQAYALLTYWEETQSIKTF